MKYDELVKAAVEEINGNDDLFIELCEALDSYSGFLEDNRLWNMNELDEFYTGTPATKLINDLTSDFNINDDYFYYSIYGLESTSESKEEFYRNCTSAGEIFDNLREDWRSVANCLSCEASDLLDMMEEIENYTEEE